MTAGRSLPVGQRLEALDWPAIRESLFEAGYARAPAVLSEEECRGLAGLYEEDHRFRARVDMARHRFGAGEYKYFAAPLPPLVQDLRERLYPPLARVANEWMELLGRPERYPASHAEFRERCAACGQNRPTPLLLRYGPGGYNCLHQDLYGDVAFPLQAAAFLSRPGIDYEGGEFLLVEQRPRAQSAGEAVVTGQGEIVIFATRVRPVRGPRGVYRAAVRHGVSRVRAGTRVTLGIVFHDAK